MVRWEACALTGGRVDRVETGIVYLEITCCWISLLYALVCQDLNYLQVIFNKYFYCFLKNHLNVV